MARPSPQPRRTRRLVTPATAAALLLFAALVLLQNKMSGGMEAQQQQLQQTPRRAALGGRDARAVLLQQADAGSLGAGAAGLEGGGAISAERRAAEFEARMNEQQALKPGDPQALDLPMPQLADAPDLASFSGPNLTCVVSARVPKLALMFLTMGPLPHERLWAEWLRKAGGLLPRSALAPEQALCLSQCDVSGRCQSRCGPAAACNPACGAALRAAYGRERGARVEEQQSLFSIYVHAPPAFPGYNGSSMFAGKLIKGRLPTEWGTHSLTQAAKNLIEEAVKDADNEARMGRAWFLLISDTTVPLYSAPMLWQQLTHERKSRIDACPHEPGYLYMRRASHRMNTTGGFRPLSGHWRKASQWFMLRREHAEMVAADSEVNKAFADHCKNALDEELNAWRDCISDEHYVASLLAFRGQDNATTCHVTAGTFVHWAEGSWHPAAYMPGQVAKQLIVDMRLSRLPQDNKSDCRFDKAVEAAGSGFIDVDKVFNFSSGSGSGSGGGSGSSNGGGTSSSGGNGGSAAAACAATVGSASWLAADEYAPVALPEACNLLARKFPNITAQPLWRLYKNCDSGLQVVPCSRKVTAEAGQWWGAGRRRLAEQQRWRQLHAAEEQRRGGASSMLGVLASLVSLLYL